jgi:hypothetical protein
MSGTYNGKNVNKVNRAVLIELLQKGVGCCEPKTITLEMISFLLALITNQMSAIRDQKRA